jgi:hypothetical protein
MARFTLCECGNKIPQAAKGPMRMKCDACRRHVRKNVIISWPSNTTINSDLPTPLVEQVKGALIAVNKVDTPEGALALYVAAMLDKGGHTAQGAAALARELRQTMVIVTAGAVTQDDPVDELRRRRNGA